MKTLEQLKDFYRASVDQSSDARLSSEVARDYYDGNQLSGEVLAEYKKRKQPPTVKNRIKPKVDSLIGIEVQSRTDPKGFPRNPDDEDSAKAITDALRFVVDNNDFDKIKTEVSEDIFVEGTGAAIIEVKQKRGQFEIEIKRIPWDRFFNDTHSARKDGEDSSGMGQALWMDKDQAIGLFPDNDPALFATSVEEGTSEAHKDKPEDIYYDAARDRVKLIEIYFFDKGWHHAIFAGNGFVVEPRPSPYLDEDGEPTNPIEMRHAFIDRKNDPYGPVKNWIPVQDEINMFSSKALHALSTRQIIMENGAVDNVNKSRNELHKSDGVLVRNKGFEFEISSNESLSAGNFNLYTDAKNEIDNVGTNAALSGKEERNLSGRAIQAKQQGGVLELTGVLDGIRDWQKRIYRQIWFRIKQFWTEERWIRVTDDERNIKFIGLNKNITLLDQLQEQGRDDIIQEFQGDPRLDQVVGIENHVPELDVDIILEDVPDIVNLQAEQFELLSNMFNANPQAIPFDMIIEASSLRNKDRILERLNGDTPEAQEANAAKQQQEARAAEISEATAIADIEATNASTGLDISKTEQTQVETQLTAAGF